MKVNFKQIGLVAAVAAVSAGFAGNASAQARAVGNLGDMAVIPYYTVQDDWATGVHIINTSDRTQVVKLRLRRASDSADALDFNLIMSPKDEWTGALSDDGAGNIAMRTQDTTCTAPVRADGVFQMPAIYRTGAEEGYIEVIGMGTPIEVEGVLPAPGGAGSAIAYYAKHVNGVPRDCGVVASNFFANGAAATTKGIVSNAASAQTHTSQGPTDTVLIDDNTFESAENVLKVSYFVRDAASGIEFGGDAVHVEDFSGEAYMTNQETGLFSGDENGFDYPDMNGGPTGIERDRFELLRADDVLGSRTVLNDWSVATARNVSTDWVITMPGQYTMIDTYVWLLNGFGATCGQIGIPSTGQVPVPPCDFRDIPVTADLTLYDREEGVITPDSGELVISPAPPGTTNTLTLPNEVNVVEWTDGTTTPVLGSAYPVSVDASVLGDFGWASLAVNSAATKTQRICEEFDHGLSPLNSNDNGGSFGAPVWADNSYRGNCTDTTSNVPIVGFVAWERSFPQNPDGNYGRLIDHSFSSPVVPAP